MTGHYTLWGTPHSLYTGKARSYLIKKQIAFVELTVSDPYFSNEVVPKVGHWVAPVVQSPEGKLIQDCTAIIDHVEARHAEVALTPAGPVQQVIAQFFDAFGSNYLLPAAMHYRWSFRAEQELFLRTEFARAIPTSLPYEQRLQTAGQLMDKFAGFLPNLGVQPEFFAAIEQAYVDLLDVLELHFQAYPYLLGGRPSVADFGMMAPLYAHLARDPVPAMLIRTRAPNVARWTERMNVAAIEDHDYADPGGAFPADDAIPETLVAVLKLAFALWNPGLTADAAQFDAWLAGLTDPAAGTLVSHDGARQVHPHVGMVAYDWRGVTMRRASHVHSLWHLARAQAAADTLQGDAAARLAALLESTGGTALMARRTARPIIRENNVLVLGQR
ncbi:MAG: glutathione S-transferase family protein [Novosphingobium sp.]|uniref:glutathione S-transferase family protein n=1 Tax=Novosphingobium sp. TaxID=1874826 RepID=UPI0032BC75EF